MIHRKEAGLKKMKTLYIKKKKDTLTEDEKEGIREGGVKREEKEKLKIKKNI